MSHSHRIFRQFLWYIFWGRVSVKNSLESRENYYRIDVFFLSVMIHFGLESSPSCGLFFKHGPFKFPIFLRHYFVNTYFRTRRDSKFFYRFSKIKTTIVFPSWDSPTAREMAEVYGRTTWTICLDNLGILIA